MKIDEMVKIWFSAFQKISLANFLKKEIGKVIDDWYNQKN